MCRFFFNICVIVRDRSSHLSRQLSRMQSQTEAKGRDCLKNTDRDQWDKKGGITILIMLTQPNNPQLCFSLLCLWALK